MHRTLPMSMEGHRAQEEERRSKGLETCPCHQLKLLERNLLGLYAQEDVSGSTHRSTWRMEGQDQIVQNPSIRGWTRNLEILGTEATVKLCDGKESREKERDTKTKQTSKAKVFYSRGPQQQKFQNTQRKLV